MDYFPKLPEAYAISSQEASTVAESVVSNFCRFGIPLELPSDQGRNFECCLLEEILQRLGVSKTCITPLHRQSDVMVERYIITVEEDLRKVVVSHQKDWDPELPILILAYRASTHDTTGDLWIFRHQKILSVFLSLH
jgi:hypothetical protein